MKRIIDSTILFLVGIFLLLAATFIILYFQLRTDQVSSMRDTEPVVRTLFVIHDGTEPVLTSVLFVESQEARIALLDIPQNIGTMIPGQSMIDSIASVFDARDPEAYRDTVSDLIGEEIPFYLVYSVDEMRDFIDLLGGIELFIITDYEETTGAPILLPSGNVSLDGRKALAYLMLDDEADREIERIGRKQSFLQALLRRVKEQAAFLNHRDVVSYRSSLGTTNIDRRSFSSLIELLAEGDTEQVIRRRVQGTVRTVDVQGVSKDLLFPHFEGQWLKQSVRQIEEALLTDAAVSEDVSMIRIEVLNGTTISGFARRTSELFEEYGFEVRRFGNAESNTVEETLVLDRRGYQGFATTVASIIQAQNIITEINPESDVDVTIILGKDFDGTVVRTE